MTATVEVRFKGNRKDYFRWPAPEDPPCLEELVLVETDRGIDCGRVTALGDQAAAKCARACSGCPAGAAPAALPARPVLRRVSADEAAIAKRNRLEEEEVRRTVTRRARSHGLDMKIVDAEWQWDRRKLTVYFTADARVDFRSLVRELATQFHTRIELRQIGARDEAARIGGVGRCGREYCCSTWLTELSPVSLSLAKDQRLSLNPGQISGGCGRLLCCLRYEHDFYVASRKRFPKEGKTVDTLRGPERVVAVDIFRERVFLRHETEGSRIIPLEQFRDEIAGHRADPPSPPAPSPPPRAEAAAAAPEAGPPPPSTPRRRRRRRTRRGGRPPAEP